MVASLIQKEIPRSMSGQVCGSDWKGCGATRAAFSRSMTAWSWAKFSRKLGPRLSCSSPLRTFLTPVGSEIYLLVDACHGIRKTTAYPCFRCDSPPPTNLLHPPDSYSYSHSPRAAQSPIPATSPSAYAPPHSTYRESCGTACRRC